MPLHADITKVVNEELERAFYRVGKRILGSYLSEMATHKAIAIQKSPELLRSAIDAAINKANSGGLRLISRGNPYTQQRTRDAINLIDETVRAQDALEGISLIDATLLIETRLGHTLRPHSLRLLIQRTSTLHKLIVRRNRIILRSDIIVDILNRRHSQRVAG